MTADASLTIAMAKRIELWPFERLRPYERNARTHSVEQVAQIAASIVEFGFTNPILVDSHDGIIAGHGRLMAAQELGLKTVPVVVLDHLSERQRKAYILADNQLALNAGWDTDILRAELQDLAEQDFDLSLIGFSDDELADLLPEIEDLPPEDADADAVPEPPADPVSKPGDVWLLGKHRVMCGDSSDVLAVERLMAGRTAEAVVTDPPYGINANRQTLGTGKKQFHRGDSWDAERPDIGWLQAFANQIVIWGGNYFADVLPPTNDWLCWHKKNDGLSFSEFELAWTNLGKNCRILSHHWSGEQKVHPTQKPAAVIEWCMSMTTGLVFDPFLGSGTSLIAAEKVGRACYGMELDPRYCDVIVKRWQQFTGKTATLEGTGEKFPEDAA
jgi:DNA modification methylase